MNKSKRIRKDKEFKQIIHKKNKMINDCFILYRQPKQQDRARFGISVSKKLGHAVTRNKIKRQLRMMLQECIDFDTYKYDGIVIVRQFYLQNSYDVNKKTLLKLLNKDIIPNVYLRSKNEKKY